MPNYPKNMPKVLEFVPGRMFPMFFYLHLQSSFFGFSPTWIYFNAGTQNSDIAGCLYTVTWVHVHKFSAQHLDKKIMITPLCNVTYQVWHFQTLHRGWVQKTPNVASFGIGMCHIMRCGSGTETRISAITYSSTALILTVFADLLRSVT